MYNLVNCGYSPNVFRIQNGYGDAIVEMICKAASGIHTSTTETKQVSKSVRLFVFEFEKEVSEIENFVANYFNNERPLIFPCTNGVLPNIKVPTRYGHVTIPIVDTCGNRMTTFDVKEGCKLHVRMQAKTAWTSKTHCGVSWVLHSIKIL